ncbi:unnamed protein product, partial [Diplocarpon coronariae]
DTLLTPRREAVATPVESVAVDTELDAANATNILVMA